MAPAQDGDIATLSSAARPDHMRQTWYFAYGSNMRASVLQNRGVTAIAKEIVVVPTHILSFDVFGVPYSEPAMASITSRKSQPAGTTDQVPAVHGVAYLVSQADYVRLLASEGAGTAYKEIECDAFPAQYGNDYGSGDGKEAKTTTTTSAAFRVCTLVARFPFRPNAPPRPSKRYLVRVFYLHSSCIRIL